MSRRRLTGAWVCPALAVAAWAAAQPEARQESPFAVVIDAPVRTEAVLNALGDKGYQCGALARPEPDVRLQDLVAVLRRPSTSASTVQYRVVSGDAMFARAKFDEALTEAGHAGYRACGLTRARPVNAREGGPHVVVLMRDPSDSLAPREYRAIFTSGAGAEWRRIETALGDGFTITRAVWAPPPGAGTIPEVVFLAERGPGASPSPAESVLETDATPAGLARRMTTRAANGYRFEIAWASPSGVSVLMTRRQPAGDGATPAYTVDASSTSSFGPSLANAHLLASIPFRAVRFAIRDASQPGLYATAEREHAAFDNPFTVRTSEARALQEDLAMAFGTRDVWPVDLVYRSTGKGRVKLEAIFDRSPGLR